MSRILIVEDESGIASFLQKGLRAEGYTTVAVDDGGTAISVARDDAFDLVVLDLGLPGRSGLEVLAALRARGERLPVIILTARDGVDATVAGLDSGADDYLTKPFRFEELLARVRARLRDRGEAADALLQVGPMDLDLAAGWRGRAWRRCHPSGGEPAWVGGRRRSAVEERGRRTP